MHKTDTLNLLRDLVAFDTVSERSNMALIGYVRDYLSAHSVESHVIANEAGTKANLFATIGPKQDGGVALSGHTDVVPVEGQDWSSDPFGAVERDGRIYGRGTCDMKGFIAAALALVAKVDAGRLKRPLHLAFSYDEEVGCTGVVPMVEAIGRDLPMPEIVIVGEPTMMSVVHAHKGFGAYETTIHGKAGHSSLPDAGVSATLIAGELMQALQAILAERAALTPHHSPFIPPHSTFNVGRLSGGEAVNIIPGKCRMEWEYRAISNEDAAAIPAAFAKAAEAIEARERERFPGVRIETVRLAGVPPFVPQADSDAEALLKRLLGTNEAGAVSFGTEAGVFQQGGMSVVICGPGDIAQAHQADEFVEVSQLKACEALLDRLAEWLCQDA